MITINFATKNYRFIQRLHIGLVIVNVFFVIATAVLIWTALSLRSDIASLDNKVKEIEAGEEELRPLLAERDQVIKNLSAMSKLMESRRFSWTQFLTNIEKIFPVGVALDKVEYNPRDRALTLDGAANSPESLRNLMVGLETSPVFRDTYLKHQSVDKGSISFNVVAYYQEHLEKTAGVGQGK